MNMRLMQEVRRLVAEGSIRRGERFIWVCPICCARVATGGDLMVISQAGTNHYLVHTDSLDSVGSSGAPHRNAAPLGGASSKRLVVRR